MAGIGVKLNKIFDKGTLTSTVHGAVYSAGITVAPFVVIITTVIVMEIILGMAKNAYSSQSLFSCTLLYIFIMSELSIAPGNTVLSKYVEDKIYNDKYEDVLPAVYVGLMQQMFVSNLLGIPVYLHLFFTGGVPLYYVFTSYMGLLALSLSLYLMLYLSIAKDYAKISVYFTIGMLFTALLSLLLNKLWGVSAGYALLVSLVSGFWIIAVLEFCRIKAFFRVNSYHFREVPTYFRKFWRLSLTNFLYMFGMFVHNFVFWNSDMRTVVASTYITANPYDVASTLAMFTNITANVIFVVQVERTFNMRYKDYSESVIGGRLRDITRAKSRLMRNTAQILIRLVQYQFVISVFLYLIFCAVMPKIGFTGMVMDIYPSLAAGYFVLFLFFAVLSFLYYYRDENGSLISSFVFVVSTLVFSIISLKFLPVRFYGAGLFLGALAGWSVGFARMRWCERNLDAQTFSVGNIIKPKRQEPDSEPVYSIYRDGYHSGLKRSKLLFVVNTMGQAGAETALCELLKKLDPEKYEIDLLSLIPRGEMFGRLPANVKIVNKKYSTGSVHDFSGRLAIAGRLAGAALYHGNIFGYGEYFRAVKAQQKADGINKKDKLLWRLLSDGTRPCEKEYDLAIAYLEGAATYYVADHVTAAKKAAFVHINYGEAGYSAVTDRGCYDKINRIFPIADGVKAKFLEVYPQYQGKTEVFHNVVDAGKILNLSMKDDGFTDEFDGLRLLTVGRLHPQKGYDIAIEACKMLKNAGTKIRWYVVGEGDERRTLEKQIRASGLENDFVLLGKKDNPYPYFAGCDIYVHATRFEGKSIAVTEAQILGCPVVASDIEGNREQIIDGRDGLLVGLNPESVCNGIKRLADDEVLRRQLSAAAAEKNQSFEEDLAKIDSLINEKAAENVREITGAKV